MKSIITNTNNFKSNLVLGSVVIALAGCASGPSKDISLIPSKTDQVTSTDGVFVQNIKWTHKKPDCSGNCPVIELDSLVFPGNNALSKLIDNTLAKMAYTEEDQVIPYDSLQEYEQYFWQTAADKDLTQLNAKTRYRNKYITSLELNAGMYVTGAAHGFTVSNFINWDNNAQKVLKLEDLIQPGSYDRYLQNLKYAHKKWMHNLPEARQDIETWSRMWPFAPSNNVAITDQGLLVKYNSYEIAPYSSGQPELIIPFNLLHDVLRPEYRPQD